MNAEQSKKIQIIDFLKSINILPERISRMEYWYRSPFRQETEASLKVAANINLWYDHGLGKGGDLIDLLKAMYNCGPSQALSILEKQNPEKPLSPTIINNNENLKNSISINHIKDISNINTLNYIKSRSVDINDVKRFAKEVHYRCGEYNFIGVGIPTLSNGWEINTQGKKNSTSPKDISLFNFDKKEIAVFEGMFNCFSLFKHNFELASNCDFLIMNSVSFKNQAAQLLSKSSYTSIHIYTDNDDSGNSAAKCITEVCLPLSIKIQDHRAEYNQGNDLNDHIRSIKQ